MKRPILTAGGALVPIILLLAGCAPRTPETVTEYEVSNRPIAEFLEAEDEFSITYQALNQTGLLEELRGEGPYTLFVPTNDAWDRAAEGDVQDLLQSDNRDQLRAVLEHHIVERELTSQDLVTMATATQSPPPLESMAEANLNLAASTSALMVGDAAIVTPDILVHNGVIHTIDEVLLPAGMDDIANWK